MTDLFSLGDAVFNYTIRVGGILMALVAVGSYMGRPLALLADAVVSIAIGVLLGFSGVAMMIGGGGLALNQLFYVLVGSMFTVAGVRYGHDYFHITATHTPHTGRDDLASDQRNARSPAAVPSEEKSPARPPGVIEAPLPDDGQQESDPTSVPEGFLASFSDEGAPPKP